MNAILYIVATPIGNLEDMSFRAVRVLREVTLIACEDTRHTAKLLGHFQIRVPTISFFEHNEFKRIPEILGLLRQGKSVALVTDAGMPGISDPGYRLVKAAAEEGIVVQVITGPCAAIAALAGSGLPTDAFTFIGFLPSMPGPRKKVLESLKERRETLVFYVSPWKIVKTLEEMVGIFGDRTCCLARELTKVHEEWLRRSLIQLQREFGQRTPKGEMTLIVAGRGKQI